MQIGNVRKLPWIRRRIIYRSLTAKTYDLSNRLEYKKAFEFLDRNKDGFISASDLTEICRIMGDELPTKSRVDRWIKKFDMNNDQKICFEEFVATLLVKMVSFMTQPDIAHLFEKCDIGSRGYITTDNLIQVMADQGKEIKVEEARLMIREMDSDDNKRIEFNEFSRGMKVMRQDILFHFGAILAT